MTKSTVLIGPGAILETDGQHLCVLRFESSDAVVVSVVETGQQKIITLSDISAIVGNRAVMSDFDLSEVDQETWRDALEKFRWIEPLLFKHDRTHADVEAVGDELLVSRVTMYRWIKKLEQQGNIRCLLYPTKRASIRCWLNRSSSSPSPDYQNWKYAGATG